MTKWISALKRACVTGFVCVVAGISANALAMPAPLMPKDDKVKIHKNISLHSSTFLEAMYQNGKELREKYAGMLGVIPTAISNLPLYSFIDEWYGVKYLWGGTTKKGIDCSALVQKAYEAVFHKPIVRTSIMQFKDARILPKNDSLTEGDLVFFKTIGNRISHVGIYLKNNYFVHSCSSKGVSINNLEDKYWSKVFAAGGRLVM